MTTKQVDQQINKGETNLMEFVFVMINKSYFVVTLHREYIYRQKVLYIDEPI
jgi:hypothetical protein